MKTATIPHRNLTLAYEEAGSGPPLVLLHAFPMDRTMWRPQLDGLSNDFRVIALDLPGFGDSGDDTSGFTVDIVADIVADFCDAIGVTGPIHLAGLSMGGYIALAFARRQPQRLRTLILADTKAEPDDEKTRANRDEMAELAHSSGAKAVIAALLPKLLGETLTPEHAQLTEMVRQIGARQKPASIVLGLQMLRERPDATPGLPRITVPTLIMVGDRDVITPPALAKSLIDRIPHSKTLLLLNAGHLSNLEAPKAFNEGISAFVLRFGR